jgi:purine-nucleoside phosphorylase
VGLILGSGLGNFADDLSRVDELLSVDIPHYPTSTVQGHAGRLVFGHVRDGTRTSPPLLVFNGRVHFYETNALAPVIFPVFVARELGVSTLIVTNAAGGINRTFHAGDLMLITDILSMTFLPVGQTVSAMHLREQGVPLLESEGTRGERGNVFDNTLQGRLRVAAQTRGISLLEGTYCWLKGPTYETAAEVEMLRRLGVDAVGMSTVPEIIAARNLALNVIGISLISNLATGITGEQLSHEEVTDTANRVQESFTGLLKEFLLTL